MNLVFIDARKDQICGICLEEVRLPAVNHVDARHDSFCRPCLRRYLNHIDRQCPYQDGVIAYSREIESLLDRIDAMRKKALNLIRAYLTSTMFIYEEYPILFMCSVALGGCNLYTAVRNMQINGQDCSIIDVFGLINGVQLAVGPILSRFLFERYTQ